MRTIDISIVCYQNYDKILKCVDSINKFTNQDMIGSIFIVDNTECEKLSRYKAEINELKSAENIEYIQLRKNIGFGSANNVSLTQSKSQYFAIVNPDILLVEEAFGNITSYMNKHSEIGAVIPKMISKDGKIQKAYRRELTLIDVILRYLPQMKLIKKRRDYHEMQDQNYDEEFVVPFAQGSFIVFRRELLERVDGFDERYFMYVEDADLCKELGDISKIVYYPNVKVVHFWEKASHRNVRLMLLHALSMMKYFKKWGIKWK
ncbi:glycosyltransferase [Ligilactobacillus equi]